MGSSGADFSIAKRPVWSCVPLSDSDQVVVLGCEHEGLIPQAMVSGSGWEIKPRLLGGRRLVRARGGRGPAPPPISRYGERTLVVGRRLAALLPEPSDPVWERIDRALGAPRYVIGTDWLQPTVTEAVGRQSNQDRPVVLLRIGDQGALWLGPELPPGREAEMWTQLQLRLRQSRPLRALLLTRVGALPDLQPHCDAAAVAVAFSRAGALLERWAARRLLQFGLLSLSPGQRVRLHRLSESADSSSTHCRRWNSAVLRPARRWISPIVGPIYRIRSVPLKDFPSVWIASAEAADGSGWANADALIRQLPIRGGGGCAERPDIAVRVAIAEAFERLAAVDDGRRRGPSLPANEVKGALCSWDELVPLAVTQLGQAGLRLPGARYAVPRSVPRSETVEWVSARRLAASGRCWVPRGFVLFGVDGAPGPHAHSDGLAAATSRHLAVQRGLLELIERDAVGIWWHARVLRPPPPSQAWSALLVRRLADTLERCGRRFWLLDLTTDIGVPVVAALSADADGRRIVIGAASAWSFAEAGWSAALELAQLLPLVRAPEEQLAIHEREWWQSADTNRQPWLLPCPEQPSTQATTRHIGILLSRLRAAGAGMEPLWVDLTADWLPVAVVRVIVPQMCRPRPWFGYRRIQEVPARLGWHTVPCTESKPLQLFW
ncbi:YcaO-like family protein [Halorhodospira abdelmalekii]|uniref:YcaO-like family protein n=1 Tax=Halorhodospira abdelmalekii TaxID=421629 RepID=UPI001908E609|nr:YcaO-like family protein [Halorhodospira abdelmalekii]